MSHSLLGGIVAGAIAAGALAAAAADITPWQMHLALAGADGMRAAWKTNDAAASACRYGPTGGPLSSSATGSSKQYFPNGGWHHVVRLGGLTPGAKYDYSCGNATAPGGSSPVATFVATTPPGAPTSILLVGDMGWEGSAERGAPIPVGGLDSNWSATLSRELMESLNKAGKYDLVWHVGDIGEVTWWRSTAPSRLPQPRWKCSGRGERWRGRTTPSPTRRCPPRATPLGRLR